MKYLYKLILESVQIDDNFYLSENEINTIFKGYLEAAFFTEEERLRDELEGDDDDDMDEIEFLIRITQNFNRKEIDVFIDDDIDQDHRIKAYLDIKKFLKSAGKDAIQIAIKKEGLSKIGNNIWYVRNGHGVGFFDANYDKEIEDRLSNAAEQLGTVDLYIGDDGILYFE